MCVCVLALTGRDGINLVLGQIGGERLVFWAICERRIVLRASALSEWEIRTRIKTD